jgi:transcriptional regulator with XRE-family HTH domain
MEAVIKELVFNLMCDLKKKELDKFARAKLIRNYMVDAGISQRQLAFSIGVSKSTVEDWLRWENMTQAQYDTHIKQGYTPTDIYESLRDGTLSNKDKAIDAVLENCISKLQVFKIKPPFSPQTKNLIDKLDHILKVIERQVK